MRGRELCFPPFAFCLSPFFSPISLISVFTILLFLFSSAPPRLCGECGDGRWTLACSRPRRCQGPQRQGRGAEKGTGSRRFLFLESGSGSSTSLN
jgi:hypothetical protein